MHDIQSLKERLNLLGAHPNKKLGQNFLVNLEIAQRIVEKAAKWNSDQIIEVGPGVGALTEHILKLAKTYKAIELDRTFADFWQSRGIEVIRVDALKLDWKTLGLAKATLISNLPYQISSTLLIDRCVEPAGIEYMILMFQKEVGQRILAKANTSDYGLLSVIAQTFWETDKFIDVGPKDFYPSPKVASRVVMFKRKHKFSGDPQKFLEFVKKAFAQRRKFLIKNVSSYNVNWEKVFTGLNINLKARAEDLSPAEFEKLYYGMMNEH